MGIRVKKIKFMILLTILLVVNKGYSQLLQDSTKDKCYIGISGGFSPARFEYSSYLLELGGHILYNWDYEYISFSYNKVFAFHFDGEDDESQFHRFELIYGRVTCLKENHKLFRNIFVGASIGLSYNIIDYYQDEYTFLSLRRNTLKTQIFGIPMGIIITGPIGKDFYGGTWYTFHIVSNKKPYVSFKYFFMINIL